MPRGIGILKFTHIFDKDIAFTCARLDMNDHDINVYIFGNKLARRVEYINNLIGRS
jgi:hypothetical protein